MHDIPLHTADLQHNAALGPFSSGFYSEDQLFSKFQSLMIANNRTLTDMIKSKLLQSFCMALVNTPSHIRTPREQSQKQYDNIEDPEMIKLRRSERLVEPAKSMLSPFVVFKNIRWRQKKDSK
ncbi:hypothetical protein Hanom_Chr07g00616681 [Helianthus anomalus]